jgi:hypothetical protein
MLIKNEKMMKFHVLKTFVADPDPRSGIRCLFDRWIRDPGWVKNQDPDSGSGAILTPGSGIRDG